MTDDATYVDPDDELDPVVDVSDEEYRRIITDLRESVEQLDSSLSEAVESGSEVLPQTARDATRRHRQAWKQFMALRKQRWG